MSYLPCKHFSINLYLSCYAIYDSFTRYCLKRMTMFNATVYSARRQQLITMAPDGLLLFFGNTETPINYAGNTYPFRQDSTFLYFFGLDIPGLMAAIDTSSGRCIVSGADATINDIIWTGPQPTVAELSARCGVTDTMSPTNFQSYLKTLSDKGTPVHFLPPYQPGRYLYLETVLGYSRARVEELVSTPFRKAVADLRSCKEQAEIEHIEETLSNITVAMYQAAAEMAVAGHKEYEIAGALQGIAASRGGRMAYQPIVSVRGETLHNHHYNNTLRKGDLLLIDAGAESTMGYATDITRTYPVGGFASAIQKEVYNLVLEAQLACIASIRPGIPYRDVHLVACETIARGLTSMGIMTGNASEAVAAGAHALFFPHGIGHMLGLDVHDMEDLGENLFGYDDEIKRSTQFGMAYLRLGRRLREGFIVTVEPGIYFIPALIDQWLAEKKFSEFINYNEVDKLRNFGGIRIEDNVVVTAKGHRVLGKPIPK